MTRRPTIPGERSLERPSKLNAARLCTFRPFVRQSGDQWRPRWFLQSRKLLDYLVVFISKGSGRFAVGDECFDVGDNDLIWIPPDTPHEMRGTSSKMHVLFAHFDLVYDPERSHWDACIPGGTRDLSALRRCMHPPIDDPVVSKWRGKIPVTNPAAIEQHLARICFEHGRSPAGAAVRISSLTLQLVDEILRGTQPLSETKPMHVREMEEAATKIRLHARGELDVGELARESGLSESHFRKLFRETYGQSPRSMHRQARIQKACEMLAYSSMNVSEVAFSLGFSTVHNFSRAFREVTGVSPRHYRGAKPARLR
jgi:AraC-like DNA-binding protein